MFCSKCGEEIEKGNLFCTKCGSKLETKIENKVKKSKNKKIRNIIIVIMLTIIISVALIFSGSKVSKKTDEEEKYVEEAKQEEIEENSEINNHYFNVLDDKEKIRHEVEDGVTEEITISEILSKNKPSKIDYCILDVDNDNCNEMYLKIELEPEPFIIILNYEEGVIYGFEFPVRGIQNLKKDGTYYGGGGAESGAVYKVEFSKEKKIETDIASQNGNVYTINKKSVTEEEFNKFMNDFNSKEDIKLIEYRGERIVENSEDRNMYEEKFSNSIIEERFRDSYDYLIDELNNLNKGFAISNQQNKCLQAPYSGKVYALYDKEKNEIVYMQYYGSNAGTEIIWIDREEESPYAKYAGNAGQTIMKPNLIKAINVNGNVLDRRSSSTDFSVFSEIMKKMESPTEEETKKLLDNYILKEFEWSINTKDKLTFTETYNSNKF